MVTGSHNPSEYNGFKMVLNKHAFYSDQIQNLQSLLESQKLTSLSGAFSEKDIKNEYIKRNLQNINLKKKQKLRGT